MIFFDKINDKGLMINYENGKARPTYFTIKDRDILWFIPLSSKVSKYKPIIKKKKNNGYKIYSTDIDKIKEKMLNELENDKLHK